ncbi:MAG: VCBS repeat-containing protein [Planctomycetota bacterium]|nr:VCBS repeat-containing protein [Planctomycetota bacterium]
MSRPGPRHPRRRSVATWPEKAVAGVLALTVVALSIPLAAQAGGDEKRRPRFVRHVLDDDLQALGADRGDSNPGSPADVIAVGRSGVYWYASGEKHVIDEFDTPTNFLHVRTGDIDRDGDVDAVAVDHRNGNIFYYENPGEPALKRKRWPRHLVEDRVKGAHAVALGDIDRDGRLDVVASGEAGCDVPDTIFWYRCPENPNSATRWARYAIGPNQSGGLAHYPGIGDVNGDGRPDVVHAAKNGAPRPDASPPIKKGEWYRLWLQPADPTKPWIFQEIASGYRQATNIQVADVNHDGVVDLVATQGHHVGILYFEGPLWRPRTIDRTLRSPHTLVVADIDGDGDTDIATCAFESRVLTWFSNNGSGGFKRHDISTDQEAYDLVARDMDGDGDLDLIVAGRNSRNVCWYEQTGRPKRAADGGKK